MENSLIYYENNQIVEKQVKALDNIAFDDLGGLVTGFVQWYANNSQLLPTWWTRSRENALRRSAIENDMLSSVIYNLVMMLNRLPLTVRPRDTTITAHARMADTFDMLLQQAWQDVAELFIFDLLVHDMGAFLLVESAGSVSTPVSNIPTGLKHLPISRVTIAPNPEFPVIYRTQDNRNVKVHESRLIRLTQMPVSLDEDYHVGLSFVSRALNVAELMRSVNQYELELLGSLESDQIIYATDTNSKSLKRMFDEAEIAALNEGRIRAGKRVFLGMRDPSAKIGTVNLKGGGQKFDRNTYVDTTIKLLALAAGVDVNQLVTMDSAGSTKSAALISDLKGKFKLASWFANKVKQELENKFLPLSLVIAIGDTKTNITETQAKTMINVVRSEKLMVETNTIDRRIARENALKNGFITESQMIYMELQDFRLPGGLHVRTLFFKDDVVTQSMLELQGFDNPCRLEENEPQIIIPRIKDKMCEVEAIAINSKTASRHQTARFALASLQWLLEEYESLLNTNQFEEVESNSNSNLEEGKLIEETPLENITLEEELQKKKYDGGKKKPKKRKKKKVFNKTTQFGRNAYREARKNVRSIWNGEIDTGELLDVLEDIISGHPNIDDDDADEIISEIHIEFDELSEYLKNHKRHDKGKLPDVYKKLDEFLLDT